MPADQELEVAAPVAEPTNDVDQSQDAADTAVETVTELQPEPKTYTRWQDALADADPEELLKHDAIAGRIGQVADKRARELEAQRNAANERNRQAEADRAETQRLRELRADNPVAYANEMDRKDATAEAIAEEAARQARMAGDITGSLAEYVTKTFSKEVVDSLAGKTYEGSYAQGVTAYIADITKASQSALRAEWEKTERPALRKQILAELNGGEPSIDSSAGGARAGKKFNSNLEASQALYDGTITVQEYTRQAYQNGWR